MRRYRPYIIALTGGPCAGKTTLLSKLESIGRIAGRKLLFVPEAATMLIARGSVTRGNVREFQSEVLRLQLQLEDAARQQANDAEEPCVIVCDRGTLDGAGYCSPLVFGEITTRFGKSAQDLARRYDLVVHLTSAALEAPAAYTISNNDARNETLDEAIAQEYRTREAWATHPNRIIVTSSEGFQAKLDQAIAAIERAVIDHSP